MIWIILILLAAVVAVITAFRAHRKMVSYGATLVVPNTTEESVVAISLWKHRLALAEAEALGRRWWYATGYDYVVIPELRELAYTSGDILEAFDRGQRAGQAASDIAHRLEILLSQLQTHSWEYVAMTVGSQIPEAYREWAADLHYYLSMREQEVEMAYFNRLLYFEQTVREAPVKVIYITRNIRDVEFLAVDLDFEDWVAFEPMRPRVRVLKPRNKPHNAKPRRKSHRR